MALAAATVWEVRGGAGADTNGGGFVTGASGTDYSQQNSAQYALTGLASAGSGNTILYASASADMVGNIANAVSGTNVNTGYYQIVSVSVGVSITFSTNNAGQSIASGVAASLVLNIGGALATVKQAVLNMGVGGMICYVKAATYTQTAVVTQASISAGTTVTMIGYTSSRDDGGQATVTTATNSTNLFQYSTGSNWVWQNFIFSNTAGTPAAGFINTNASYTMFLYFINCKFTGFTYGVYVPSGSSVTMVLYCQNCWFTANTNGIYFNQSALHTIFLDNTLFNANTTDGVLVASGGVFMFGRNTVFYNQGSKGISFTGTSSSSVSFYLMLDNCAFVSNTSDGLADSYSTSPSPFIAITNTIFDSNGGYGVNFSAAPNFCLMFNNAPRGNSPSAYNNVTSVNDVSPSGSPFTNPSGLDFSLNSTAGQGAALSNTGFPGVLQKGGTGYAQIGPLVPNTIDIINNYFQVLAPRRTVYESIEGTLTD